MKLIYKIIAISFLLGSVSVCQDFDKVNQNPYAATADQVQLEYFLNNSIIGAQQDPHIAERVFVLYWKDAGHFDRLETLSTAYVNDGWSADYYRYVTDWLNSTYSLFEVYEYKKGKNTLEPYSNNVYQIARIWRAYLISEFVDNFGPYAFNGFKNKALSFNTVEETYDFMLKELKEAVAGMDDKSIADAYKKFDSAYNFDLDKWKKYANSMRMRLAMRISNAKPTEARAHFEDAYAGGYIAKLDEMFAIQEKKGWNPLEGVMTREWNDQMLSTTLNNLMIGLGGITTETQIKTRLEDAITKINAERAKNKPDAKAAVEKEGNKWTKIHEKTYEKISLKINAKDYLGVKESKVLALSTNNPLAEYRNDGLYNIMDPRAYVAFAIPGDFNDLHFCGYPSWNRNSYTTVYPILEKKEVTNNGNKETKIDTLNILDYSFTWNTYNPGIWGDVGALNPGARKAGTTPRLIIDFRNSSRKRVFFAPWESYFLIAEAKLKGWNVDMTDKDAYEKGITTSFEYWDSQVPDRKISGYLANYLASEEYNVAGTSVKYEHVTEPNATVPMKYTDPIDKSEKTVQWSYAKNDLYQNGSVRNDKLTKIITQKFIAQFPWLPLETWSDHRRLGLPFFENPVVEQAINGIPSLTKDSSKAGGKWEFFPQRLKYPSNFKANSPREYAEAVQKLGGPDEVMTPFFWAAAAKK